MHSVIKVHKHQTPSRWDSDFIKLKYAINIHLTALNVTYNPKKNITDKKKVISKKKHQIQTKLKNATQGILGTSVYCFFLQILQELTVNHLTGFYCSIFYSVYINI